MTKNGLFQLKPIGYVMRAGEDVFLQIDEEYRPAMKQLEHFSHVIAFWWADKHDNTKSRKTYQCEPPYAQGHVTGVFATRAEYRPNPIAMTISEIIDVDHMTGRIQIRNIDAFDETPLLDLKAYFPVCDRVKECSIPEWLSDWPEWLPEEGLGLEVY